MSLAQRAGEPSIVYIIIGFTVGLDLSCVLSKREREKNSGILGIVCYVAKGAAISEPAAVLCQLQSRGM